MGIWGKSVFGGAPRWSYTFLSGQANVIWTDTTHYSLITSQFPNNTVEVISVSAVRGIPSTLSLRNKGNSAGQINISSNYTQNTEAAFTVGAYNDRNGNPAQPGFYPTGEIAEIIIIITPYVLNNNAISSIENLLMQRYNVI